MANCNNCKHYEQTGINNGICTKTGKLVTPPVPNCPYYELSFPPKVVPLEIGVLT